MFRQPFLPCACLRVTLGLAVWLAPLPAWSQDYGTQERLDRVERDLNMLQRQVYRGGPPSAMGGGDPGAAVNAQVRIDRIETQMRDLTGRVEEFMNQIEQVRRRLDQLNSDVDMRFGQGGGGGGPAPLASAGPASPRMGGGPSARLDRGFPQELPNADDEPLPPRKPSPGPRSLMPPGTAVPPPGGFNPGGPTPIFGTLTPPGAAPEFASAAPASQPAAAGGLPNGSTAEQYNYAFGLLKQANYPAAEVALKAFVEQHPRDAMAGNAQYWLGETYYTRNKFMEAATTFAEGYKRYPKGAKAADGLLKLGMALARADQKQNACVALGQLDRDFPNPGASIKERAAVEKKKLGC